MSRAMKPSPRKPRDAAQVAAIENEGRLMPSVGARRSLRAGVALRIAAWLGALCLFSVASRAAADARSDYLIRLLQDSTQFRVRAQAAISLGGVESAPEVVDALMKSLSDEHPAVRAAAANSLGRLSDGKALRALHAAENDSEPPGRAAVKAANARIESSPHSGGGERAIQNTAS